MSYKTIIWLCILFETCLFDINYSKSACGDVEVVFFVDTDVIKDVMNPNSIAMTVLHVVQNIIANGFGENSGLSVWFFGKHNLKQYESKPVYRTNTGPSIPSLNTNVAGLATFTLLQPFNSIAANKLGGIDKDTKSFLDSLDADIEKPPTPVKEKRSIWQKIGSFFRRKKKTTPSPSAQPEPTYVTVSTTLEQQYINAKMFIETKIIPNHPTRQLRFFSVNGCLSSDGRTDQFHYLVASGLALECMEANIDDIFTRFRPGFYRYKHKMERLFDVTCPARIETPNGELELGNHNQWIDNDELHECHMVYDKPPDHEGETKLKIWKSGSSDDDVSYIVFKSDQNKKEGGNSYQIRDYLLANDEVYPLIKAKGCDSPVYRIINIRKVRELKEGKHEWIFFKAFVKLPKSPTDYVALANVKLEDHEIDPNHPIPAPTMPPSSELVALPEGKGFLIRRKTGKNKVLLNKTFSKDWTKKWTKETKKVWRPLGIRGPRFRLDANGHLELKTGFNFSVTAYLDYDFYWNYHEEYVRIMFKIHGIWQIHTYFYVFFGGQLTLAIDDILNFGQTFTFFIGPVPIVIKPFFAIDAKLETKPVTIFAGVHCTYQEKFSLGYHYEKDTDTIPPYATLKTNTKFDWKPTKIWNNIASEEKCAMKAHGYGLGNGWQCRFFDYDEQGQLCRCMGIRFMKGVDGDSINYPESTTYYMGKICEFEIKTNKCRNKEIFIMKDSGKYLCSYCSKHKLKIDIHHIIANQPIRSRNALIKECVPHFGVGRNSSEAMQNDGKCPAKLTSVPIGMDISLDVRFGVSLYVIIQTYFKASIIVPLRMHLPELDKTICKQTKTLPAAQDICTMDSNLFVSFTYAMRFELRIGVKLDVADIFDFMTSLTGKDVSISNNIGVETPPILSITLIDTKSLGCIMIKPNKLSEYFKRICCSSTSAKLIDYSENVYDNNQIQYKPNNFIEYSNYDPYYSNYSNNQLMYMLLTSVTVMVMIVILIGLFCCGLFIFVYYNRAILFKIEDNEER